MTLQTNIEYRYYLTDLLTNTVISEVPFKNVSYERVNRKAGGFSGTIPFLETTKALDLYEATMPGRTGLYIMRNGVCVWGGIIWARTYDVRSQELSVDGAEFVSYLYHRNIWQTITYGSEYVGITAYSISGGTATITTETAHGFSVGQIIKITTVNPAVDGNHVITNITAANQFQYASSSANTSGSSTSGACRLLADTFDVARDLVYRINTDLGGVNFSNEAIRPAKDYDIPIVKKERSANVVTITTEKEHEIIVGQEVSVYEVGSNLDGTHFVTEVPTSTTFRYNLNGPDVPPSPVSGLQTYNVISRLTDNVFGPNGGGTAELTLDRTHNSIVGSSIVVKGVDSFFTGVLDTTYDGRQVISAVPASNKIRYVTGSVLADFKTVAGGTVTMGSKVSYGDYGSYLSNSDIGIALDSSVKSGYYRDTLTFRGYQNKTVGEILEDYSNSVDGPFEYRIDCDYDYDTASFTRKFEVFPSDLEFEPANGDYYTAEELGADQRVFEYPGNILTFTIEESAEESATRFFVVGRIEDMNDDASQPYAGASVRGYLSNTEGRSWPLLDQVEQLDEVEDENTLYEYAQDYLYEALPPIGTYNIQVNGSLSPLIGSYNPGDWCSIIIDDEFVRQRLGNDQEPRDDILIRKIESYKVSVPDSPTFPETVDLVLVPDWKVDKKRKMKTIGE
jgi:hypothetical protein